MRRVLLAAAGAALLAPAPAHAVLVLDEGMAGIRIGMFDDQALTTLGPPTTSRTVRDRNGSLEIQRYFKGPKVKYVATLPEPDDPDRTVTLVTTRRGIERTADGIGVGTHERTLRAKIPGLKCITGRFGGPRSRLCFTKGRPIPDLDFGRDQTQFTVSLKSRLVTQVRVLRAFD